MHGKPWLLSAALFLPLSTLPLTAQAEPAAADDAEEVIVTVTREPLSVNKVAQRVDVLDARDIRTYQSLYIADLLVHTGDLSLTRNGGPGEAASASIRGAGADHTLYLLDGVRLNDPSQVGGGTNLGLLATGDAARVEVLRGPLSTLWGSGALGGVVSITSAEATRPLEGQIALEGLDHYGSLRASVGGKDAGRAWRVSASRIDDQGISAFAGGSEKDGFRQSHASAKFSQEFGATTLRAYAATTHSRNAYDGYPAPSYQFADSGDSGVTDSRMAVLALDNRFAHGRHGLTVSATDTRRHDRFDDGSAFVARGSITSADYHVLLKLGAIRLLGGASLERDGMTTTSPAPWDPAPASLKVHATVSSLYGQVSRDFQGGAVIALSARHDDASSFGGQDIAQLQASLPLGAWRLHASAGQGYKVPSLYQLYSDYGTASLKAERATTVDAGLDYGWDSGRLTLTAFGRRVRDLISFRYDGCAPTQVYGCYGNVARARADGLELGLKQDFSTWTLRADYSLLRTRDGTGKRLPHTPRTMGSLDAQWQASDRLSLGLGVRGVGPSFDDSANTVRLARYTLIDLRGDLALGDRLSLYGRIENTGDTRYVTAAGYGQTGRRLWLGVRAVLF